MVFGPKQIEEVVRSEQGLLAGNCQGKGWIDCTTSNPMLMRELAQEFEQLGGLPVDAPRALADGTMKRFVDWHVKKL